MKLSVIISTYNSELWLAKVLQGFAVQLEKDFEIIIADDGSTKLTKDVIQSFKNKFKYPIIHVWQEDYGFQKCKILNKAILKANSEYLLFTDGDCIPRKDFVLQHLNYKEEGYFLSGGYFKLSLEISNSIEFFDIESQNCFSISWLFKKGLSKSFKTTKLVKNRFFSIFMNWITTTKPSWNGHNSSGYKNDILAINGFNESMEYGGEDRELGERLYNFGILAKQIRYSAICLHLEHDRNYIDPEKIKKNKAIRKYNLKHNVSYIENGIFKLKKK